MPVGGWVGGFQALLGLLAWFFLASQQKLQRFRSLQSPNPKAGESWEGCHRLYGDSFGGAFIRSVTVTAQLTQTAYERENHFNSQIQSFQYSGHSPWLHDCGPVGTPGAMAVGAYGRGTR